MHVLQPQVFAALERLSAERQWPEISRWMGPEPVAWLAYRLEFVPDVETYSLGGKWATIQRLQALLRQLEKAEAEDRSSGYVE